MKANSRVDTENVCQKRPIELHMSQSRLAYAWLKIASMRWINPRGEKKTLTISLFASLFKHGLFGLLDHHGFKTSIIDKWTASWWVPILFWIRIQSQRTALVMVMGVVSKGLAGRTLHTLAVCRIESAIGMCHLNWDASGWKMDVSIRKHSIGAELVEHERKATRTQVSQSQLTL